MNSPKIANKFLLGFIIYSLILQLLLAVLMQFVTIPTMFFLVFQDFLLILIPVVIYFSITKRKITDVIPINKLSIKNIIYVIAITILSYPIMSFVSYISTIFVSAQTNDEILQYINNYPFIICMIAFALLPAIFEEILCRGVILSNYKTTSPIVMYILSGLAFGIIHMNFQQMSYAIVAGIMLGFVVHQTNSILSSMLSHFVINGGQVLLAKAVPSAVTGSDMVDMNIQGEIIYLGCFSLICIMILIPIIKKFVKYNRANAQNYINNEDGTNKKFIDIYLIFSIIVFVAFAIIFEYLIKWGLA